MNGLRVWSTLTFALVVAAVGAGCAGGSVAAPRAAASVVSLNNAFTIAPTTVPLANPSPGAPLTVTIPTSGGGSATLTYPAGTTVTPGTSITISTIPITQMNFVQDLTRRNAQADFGALFCQNDCGGVPTASGAQPSAGLYVDVAQGAIVVSNNGGSSAFAAGQFGYVASLNQPPIVIPPNVAVPIDPLTGHAGVPVPISVNNGQMTAPVMLPAKGSVGLAFLTLPTAIPIPKFTLNSTAAATLAATPVTMTLPDIGGSFGAAVTFPATTSVGSITGALAFAPPNGAAQPASVRRGRANIGGSFSTIEFLTLTAAVTTTFASAPSFRLILPPGASLAGNPSAYLAMYDASAAAAGWNLVSGAQPLTNGTPMTFALTAPLTLSAGVAYTFALVQTAQTLALPTATPSASPIPSVSPSPSPIPSASPSAAPSASPTPLVASAITTIVPSFGTLNVPALAGVSGTGTISYDQSTSGSTQQIAVSVSTGNFAGLTVPAGQTAVEFLTVSFPLGNPIAFTSVSGPQNLNLDGPAFTLGASYTVTTVLGGAVISTGTAAAVPNDAPGGTGAALTVATPLNGFTLNANQQVGIIVSH